MRFALGYPVRPDWHEPICQLVGDYRDSVAEVFFAWPGDASGRAAPQEDDQGIGELREQLRDDLRDLRGMGVKLDLLLNASCYGGQAIGRELQAHVRDVIAQAGVPEVVTTTSPAVAHVVKHDFPGIEVRASVNMRIGTVAGLGHLADLFDSFYIQRDVQRNLSHVRRLRQWADANAKRLCMLANSGCLRFCPAQTFHDNFVAHAADVRASEPVEGFEPLACRRVLVQQAKVAALLQATWVRPEDMHHYAGLIDVVKLATRTHDRPRLVLDAYARGRFHGNLPDLLEPGYGPMLAPKVIDNDRFPEDWFARTSQCDGCCEACDYCRSVLNRTLVDIEGQRA